MKKKKIYKIQTEAGIASLSMIPVDKENLTAEKPMLCDFCPYNGLCNKIPDPRNVEDNTSTFMDLCMVISNTEDDDYGDYVPELGSVEGCYSNQDVVQSLIKKNPLVSTHKVIDSVCGELGLCPDYNKEHSECSDKNKTCILRQLFKNE